MFSALLDINYAKEKLKSYINKYDMVFIYSSEFPQKPIGFRADTQ